MAPPLTIGCVLYGLSGIGFGLCLLGGMILSWAAARKRKERIGDLPWAEQLQIPKSDEDKRNDARAVKVFCAAFVCFAVGVSVEIWGLGLGLFGSETSCPAGWSQPRSLRALQS